MATLFDMTPLFFQANKNTQPIDRVIYLDRDGVLLSPVMRGNNVSSARSMEEVVLCDDAVQLCASLKDMGYGLVVVSNQPDLSRGLIDIEFLEATNQAIKGMVDIDCFLYCPHQDTDQCSCRKPKLGLIEFFRAQNYRIPSLEAMIGDRVVDYECALAAKVHFLLKIQPYSFFGDGIRLIDAVPAFSNLIDAQSHFDVFSKSTDL